MRISLFQNIKNSWKQLTNGSINRQIFGAAVIVALLTVFVKVISVVKELVVAWKFGTGDDLDAFFIALLVSSFLINVIANSFNAALIPTYIQVRQQEGTKAAQRLFSGVTICGLGLLTIAIILMVITAPLYLPWIAGGFERQKLDLTFHLLCVLSPVVILSGITVIWSAILNAGERFALAALSPILTPFISIAFILGIESWGIFTLATGLVCGAVLEIVVLGIGLKQQGVPLLPKWYGFNSHLRQVVSQFAPTVAGSLLMCSTTVVDQSMAAMLPSGSVAALNYGNRVIALPITLTTTALSTAIIPYFSKMIATKDWQGVRHTLQNYLKLIFAVTVPLTIILIVFSEFIVKILFQRGSFTASDTHLVAEIQNCYALQIPFYIASILVVRLISAMQVNQILMWGSSLNLIVNIIGNYLFMHWLGVPGIALSTSCVFLLSFLYLFLMADKYLKKKLTIK